jgi:outer membrane protein
MTSKIFASVAGVTLSLMAAAAQAQTPAAPAANDPVRAAATAAEASAPVIPGICVYSQDIAIGSSVVGKAVQVRLGQLNAQTNAEVNDAVGKWQADVKTFQASAATLPQDQQQQQGGALQQRQQQLEQLAQIREREMQLTQQNALGQVSQALDPLIIDSFTAHKCSILVDRNATFLASAGMDITKDLVARLDSKIQTLSFDRVTIPQDGAPPPVAGPAPRAAAPARAPAAAARPAAPAAGGSARTKK